MYQICFTIGDDRQCFPVPQLYVRWPWPRWWDQNWTDQLNPTPVAWKGDLVVLATVRELLAHLSDQRTAARLTRGVDEAAAHAAEHLPEGVELNVSSTAGGHAAAS